MTRKRMLAGVLAAFFALGAVACEVDDFEDPMLDDDPMLEDEGFGEEEDDL